VEIGVRIPHTGAQATPEFVREWCTVADEAGFGSLWGVDHVVMPEHVESKYDLPRTPADIEDDAVSELLSPNFELITTLAFVAAVTGRIKIGSAVAVLTIRNAVLTARQLATIDRYSGGRLLFGIGVGWLKEEADAMNMPWDRRGARVDESIALLRTIWTAPGKHVEFHGEFWDVPPIDPEPRPVQPSIPILIGGHSAAAIDRAVRLGDGWIAAGMSPERLSEMLPVVHAAADRHGRDPSSVVVYCQSGRAGATIDDLRRYEELGVHSLQIHLDTMDELKRFADEELLELSALQTE
jgi:probable F420-dependent oxidoreductase